MISLLLKNYHITVAALFLALFSGCANSLPYSISIDSSNKKADCLLSLDKVTQQTINRFNTGKEKEKTIKLFQIEFEFALKEAEGELGGYACKNKNGKTVKQVPLHDVVTKRVLTYSSEGTDPNKSMDRLGEFLNSSQTVETLSTTTPLHADIGGYHPWFYKLLPWVDKSPFGRLKNNEGAYEGSQWCGSPEDKDCYEKRSLYRIVHHPENLYENLKDRVKDITSNKDRNRRIAVLGYEIPWDADKTLIRYGVTFYFDDQSLGGGKYDSKYIGYDLVYANEATPKPYVIKPERTKKKSPWRANPWNITGYPFSFIIGAKNAAFEVVKIPFSFIGGMIGGRDSIWKYPYQNLLTAYDTLAVEWGTQTEAGAVRGIHRLLTEIPLVGQVFQINLAGNISEPDTLPSHEEMHRKIFLSRGIYGGNQWGQDTGLWFAATRQAYPDYDVYSPPYKHGTVTDVVWSMLNLSHGPAYNEARYIMKNAERGDRIYLAGHSGGVQRSAIASRILWLHDYPVTKVVGIAGPSIGQAFVDTRYPNAFQIYLNTESDIVSKVGTVASGITTLLDYSIVGSLKYTVGGVAYLFSNKWRENVYDYYDHVGFSNATITQTESKPSGKHETPLRLSLNNRVVFDAYIRSEFATAFREDTERAGEDAGGVLQFAVKGTKSLMGSDQDAERPGALSWSK